MKSKKSMFFGLLLATSLTATAAYGQTITPSSPSPSTSTPALSSSDSRYVGGDEIAGLRARDLLDPKLWEVLLLTLGAGAIGGLVFELLNLQGNVEKPHSPTEDELAAKFAYANAENVLDLGIVARLIIGALSAPPVVALVRPDTAFVMLATSVIAGSAGTLIFRALQDRLLASVLQTGKGDVTAPTTADAPVDKALNAVEKLDNKLARKSVSPPGKTELQFPNGATLDRKELEQVALLLSEARGVNSKAEEACETFEKLRQEAIEKLEKPQGKDYLKFPKGGSLNLEKVKTLLIEAKGATETANPTDGRTSVSSRTI